MAFILKIAFADGAPWFTETGDSKEHVIRKLQARADTAKMPASKARVEEIIRELQSS